MISGPPLHEQAVAQEAKKFVVASVKQSSEERN
uniref:Uncharacterized protein n=1 Tax=Arundo donax TaxID=35708 RepID=A0A0A9AZ15_ARUDO